MVAPANKSPFSGTLAPAVSSRVIPRSACCRGDASKGPTAPVPPTPPTPDQQDQEQQRARVKTRLRQLVSKVNAAALPGPADLAALDGAIRQLIRLNPRSDTATSDLINGRWVLLYTASVSTLQRASVAAAASASGSSAASLSSTSDDQDLGSYGEAAGRGAGGGDGGGPSPLQVANDIAYRFFYTYVPVLAGAAVGARGGASAGPVKPRGNFQVFDTRAGRVENQARFEVAGRLCCVNVNGTAEVAQSDPGNPRQPRQRLRAVFTSFDVLVDGERGVTLPLSLLNPVGYVDTPYLDEEIRISVGDKGSVFIAARDGACSPRG